MFSSSIESKASRATFQAFVEKITEPFASRNTFGDGPKILLMMLRRTWRITVFSLVRHKSWLPLMTDRIYGCTLYRSTVSMVNNCGDGPWADETVKIHCLEHCLETIATGARIESRLIGTSLNFLKLRQLWQLNKTIRSNSTDHLNVVLIKLAIKIQKYIKTEKNIWQSQTQLSFPEA